MSNPQKDTSIFQQILTAQPSLLQSKPKGYHSSFLVHIILKAIPLILLTFQTLFTILFNRLIITQIIIICVVIDFWFTKNITGKRMIGLRWFFDEDKYNQEHLMFQLRANEEYVDQTKARMFWIVQAIYCVVPLFILTGQILSFNVRMVLEFRKLFLYAIIIVSAAANLFYFYKARQAADQRRNVLKSKLGIDFIKKLGLGSITTHF